MTPTAVALNMLRKYGVRAALSWANDHQHSYDRGTPGYLHWAAIYARIKELSRVRS